MNARLLGILGSCLIHGGLGLCLWVLVLLPGSSPARTPRLELAVLSVSPEEPVAAPTPSPAPMPPPRAVVPPPPPVVTPAPPPAVTPAPPVPETVAQAIPAPAPEETRPPAAGPVTPPASVAAVTAPAPSPATAPAPPAVTETVAAAPGMDLTGIHRQLRQSFVYPRRARQQGWEGRVLVAFHMTPDGAASDIKVLESSGHRLLDESAVATIRKASPFTPPPGRDVDLAIPVVYALR